MLVDELEVGDDGWAGSWRWWMGWKFALMDSLEIGVGG